MPRTEAVATGRDSAQALPTTFGYKPALDGLRAVAVGSVMAFHFGADGFEGGFLGVDTFFVLSGYLITSLLLTEWGRTSTIHFAAFWIRRARRLLPALFIVLIAIAIWIRLDINTDRLGDFRADMLWTTFYGANWHFIGSGESYFDLFSDASPLRHAWSLAIEEQFYLFWPLITFGCLRLARGRTRVLTSVCVGGIVASVIAMILLYESSDPSRAYYGTDSRASQLLVGALLAIVLTRWAPRSRSARVGVQAMGIVGAAFCLWAFMSVTDRDAWLYHGGFLLFAVATAAVIVAITQPEQGPLSRVLAIRPVRWIGQVSYGLYLWHWPVQVALSEPRTGLSGWDLALLRLAVTFTATTLSYYLVELPIRHGALKGRVARAATPLAFIAVTIVILVSTAAATTPPEFLTANPNEVISTPAPTGQPETPQAGLGTVLLLGDSVAASLGDALGAEAASRGIPFHAATRPGCGMVTGIPALPDGTEVGWGQACADGTPGYLQDALAASAPDVVLWLSTWETADRIVDGTFYEFGTPAADRVLLDRMEVTRAALAASGATIIIVANTPNAEQSDVAVRNRAQERDLRHLNALYRQFAAAHPDSVRVLNLPAIVCPGGVPCPAIVDGVRLRPRDGGHFEGDGPAWVAPRLFDALGELPA